MSPPSLDGHLRRPGPVEGHAWRTRDLQARWEGSKYLLPGLCLASSGRCLSIQRCTLLQAFSQRSWLPAGRPWQRPERVMHPWLLPNLRLLQAVARLCAASMTAAQLSRQVRRKDRSAVRTASPPWSLSLSLSLSSLCITFRYSSQPQSHHSCALSSPPSPPWRCLPRLLPSPPRRRFSNVAKSPAATTRQSMAMAPSSTSNRCRPSFRRCATSTTPSSLTSARPSWFVTRCFSTCGDD